MENSKQPAFPCGELINHGEDPSDVDGLSKREYFAGLAMQAFIGKCISDKTSIDGPIPNYKIIAECSVIMADRLLKELDE